MCLLPSGECKYRFCTRIISASGIQNKAPGHEGDGGSLFQDLRSHATRSGPFLLAGVQEQRPWPFGNLGRPGLIMPLKITDEQDVPAPIPAVHSEHCVLGPGLGLDPVPIQDLKWGQGTPEAEELLV